MQNIINVKCFLLETKLRRLAKVQLPGKPYYRFLNPITSYAQAVGLV